jgi:hypothetical protein
MIEPTITQNSALYLAHHRTSKQRAKLFQRLGFAARKERVIVKQQQAFDDLLFWRLIHRAGKR